MRTDLPTLRTWHELHLVLLLECCGSFQWQVAGPAAHQHDWRPPCRSRLQGVVWRAMWRAHGRKFMLGAPCCCHTNYLSEVDRPWLATCATAAGTCMHAPDVVALAAGVKWRPLLLISEAPWLSSSPPRRPSAAAGALKLVHDCVMMLSPFILEQLLKELQGGGSRELSAAHHFC